MAIPEITQVTVAPGENRGKSFDEGGFGVLFKIFGSETGGALAVVEHPVGPHRLIPPHTHSDVDEYSYVIEGEIGARIGDHIVSAGPGTYVLKPRGIMHAYWNATDRPARIIEILSPAKFEKYFMAMADLVKHPGPDLPQKLAALSAEHQNIFSTGWVAELKQTYKLKLLGEP